MEHDVELLKFFHEEQRNQLSYRRAREFNIFSWSNAILLAIIGSVLYRGTQNIFLYNSVFGLILIITVILGITIFSIIWQIHHRKCAATHQKIIANINNSLGCFDGTHPLFPKEWQNWGRYYHSFIELIKCPSKVSATLISGLIAMISAIITYSI